MCPRARDLVGVVIPRGLSFVVGLISHLVEEINPFDKQKDLNRQLVEFLSTAVRRGFDLPEKLLFAMKNPSILSRVQAHREWADQHAPPSED